VRRYALAGLEILILSAVILATRCANYQDVCVGQNIYFTDADCYARMTRVRICAEHPGTIIRHHDFENFPQGTTPHTTAPLDYLIVALSILLKQWTAQSLDLAGAVISPLLALVGGFFLWWWSRRMKFSYRWVVLILYSISPILVHGTELGRPDHQSLLMLLVTVGICGEWSLQAEQSCNWAIVSGVAWGLALWVSVYEPLILLGLIVLVGLTKDRQTFFGRERRIGWIIFAAIIAIAFLIERRISSLPIFQSAALFQNWSRTIGELGHVSPLNRVWFIWAGYLIAIAPILVWYSIRKRAAPPTFVLVLLVGTFILTVWQARWSYFFLSIFAISLPTLLGPIKSRAAVWIAFALSILPTLQFWDGRLWPNDLEMARRIENRNESAQLRDLALLIRSTETHPFLAPWWLSPAISYWSAQPGVAGSSHEALDGITDSARFFLADDLRSARQLLQNRRIEWVFCYDWDRLGPNSAELLGRNVPERAVGRILDRSPTQTPAYLVLSGQNGTAKLFRFADKL